MIIRSDYPILEYDPDSPEVLRPDHSIEGLVLPEKCVYVFLGETVHEYAKEHRASVAGKIETATRDLPIYVVDHQGEEIVLFSTPVGAAEAALNMDSLIGWGVKKILCGGSCGTLADLPENHFVIPVRALRDEGASYKYLPAARTIEIDPEMTAAIRKVLDKKAIKYHECMTWTTDGFFRETEDMIAYRKEEGCEVVEMECAGLAACARKRGVQFGQLLFTADSLADTQSYDERDWGRASRRRVVELLFDIAAEM